MEGSLESGSGVVMISRMGNTVRTLVLVKVRGRTSSEDDEMYNKEKDGGK